jgi:superfamily II DNA/RNA helicase
VILNERIHRENGQTEQFPSPWLPWRSVRYYDHKCCAIEDRAICSCFCTFLLSLVGMGIDLGHVKYVIHWAMAKSVEGFYQESGRAGRDGKNALSILYYSKDDASKFAFLIKKNQESKRRKKGAAANSRKESDAGLAALQGMIDYCTKACCRRQFLLKHFGETIDSKTVCKKTCDYCQDPKKVANAIEMSQVVKQAAAGFRRSKFFSTTTKTKAAWDGQWDQPHGSSFSDEEDIGNFSSDWDDGIESQGIQDASSLESSHKAPLSTRFSKASDILGKFEVG